MLNRCPLLILVTFALALALVAMSCPNPQCNQQFPDEQSVCEHLAQPQTVCREWMREVLDIMVQGVGRKRNDDDNEEEERLVDQGVFTFQVVI